MRIRPGKWGIRAGKNRDFGKGFAYWPKRLSNGTWIWLESYRRYSSYYVSPHEKEGDPI